MLVRRSWGAQAIVLGLLTSVAGCGLTLDYDPPTVRDGGIDALGRLDAGLADAGSVCRTSVDCDDGQACNGEELCSDGACVPGEAIECDDGDLCNGTEACEEGACVTTAFVCPTDSDPCNGLEICDAVLGCVSTPAPDCDDGIHCTSDSCAEGEGCRHEPESSLCTDGPEGVCIEGDGCQYATCNSATCVAGPCQTATCTGSSCVRRPLCEGGEMCCAGACVPAGCADGNPCTADTCGPTACVHMAVSGPSCSDGDGCTLGDHCTLGVCTSTGIVTCADSDPCTDNMCESPSGACRSAPNTGAPCNDRDACTSSDRCSSGLCQPGGVVVACLSPGPCIASTCDAALGCVDTPLPPGTVCGTDRICDTAGLCECRSGTADCDFDGRCECDGICSGTVCRPRCMNDSNCGAAEACCPSNSLCYATACLSCCPVTAPDAGTGTGFDASATLPDARGP